VLELLFLVLQSTVHLSAISYVAWHWQRVYGMDAFHLTVSLSGAVLVVNAFGGSDSLSAWVSVCSATVVGYTLTQWTGHAASSLRRSQLLVLIVLAVSGLTVLDWLTENSPTTILHSVPEIRMCGVVLGVASLATAVWFSRGASGTALRLGRGGSWALEYWAGGVSPEPRWFPAVIVAAFGASIMIPLTTTGVMSSTVFRDTTVAILMARVASTRGATRVLLIAFTVALLRAGAGYAFVTSWSGAVVEAAVVVALAVWLRARTSRSAWEVK